MITYDIVRCGNMFDVYEYLEDNKFFAKCCKTMGEAIRWIKMRRALRNG